MAKRIKNTKSPDNQVKNSKEVLGDNATVVLDFSYKNWIKGYKDKDLTTFVENEEVFSENMFHIFNELIPYVYTHWKTSGQFGHCHTLNKFSTERTRTANKKYRKAIECLHPNIEVNAEELELYQLGLNGSVRVICGKVNNKLYPLLIDHYHLGYDSKYHNDKNFDKFSYCPVKRYSN